jgi:hypothetical protein
VGGVSLSNTFGSAGMSLDDVNGPLQGVKSWFMFDNEIVCLGAGITSSAATNTPTTVENRRLNSAGNTPLIANGLSQPVTLPWTSTFTNLVWCSLDGVGGYVFPGGARIGATRAARTGSWSLINGGGSTTTTTRNYLSLIWDHGIAPTNSVYSYILLPNATANQTLTYAGTPQLTILTNKPSMQAVREHTLGILAAHFWSAGGGTIAGLTASDRAAILVRTNLSEIAIAVSDPTWTNPGPIVVTLNRRAASVIQSAPGISVRQLTPSIELTFATAGGRGRSLEIRLATPTSVTANPDSAATGSGTPILIDVLANDASPNDQPLQVVSLTAPTNGVVRREDAGVVYTPAGTFAGTDAFDYLVSDGSLLGTGRVTVAVGGAWLPISPTRVSASTNDGNVPENVIDQDLSTRWSALGNPQHLQVDLVSPQRIDAVSLAFYQGASRTAFFDLATSGDGAEWVTRFTGQSSGVSTNLERFDLSNHWARYVRYVGRGNSQSAWNSITELLIHTLPNTNGAPPQLTLNPPDPLPRLLVSAEPGRDYAVQASANLMDWSTVWRTNPSQSPFRFADRGASNEPSRYYRLRIEP